MQAPAGDVHNFSTPSSHRLPTISGIEAIRNVVQNARPIPTGLVSLDAVLSSSRNSNYNSDQHFSFLSSSSSASSHGGLRRGQVIEVFGPPGVGKTTFLLQVAVKAMLLEQHKVIWLNAGSPLTLSRLHQIFVHSAIPAPHDHNNPSAALPVQLSDEHRAVLASRLKYVQLANFAQLLALILHPMPNFPPTGTGLVVIDDLSNLMLSSLPRVSGNTIATSAPSQVTPTQIRNDYGNKQAASRRLQIISSLASSLQAFAASRNVAVLLTSKASASWKTGQRAVLRPALSSQRWDSCLTTRIALFRDFWPDGSDAPEGENSKLKTYSPTEFERHCLRFAQVTSLNGKDVSSPEIGFVIEDTGLREVISPPGVLSPPAIATTTPSETKPRDLDEEEAMDQEYVSHHESHDAASQPDEKDLMSAIVSARKRKAIEIADSEDEADVQSTSSTDTLPNPSTRLTKSTNANSVLSSSQKADYSTLSMPKNSPVADVHPEQRQSNATTVQGEAGDDNGDDEMLLDQFEHRVEAPLFSQVAAEMSDPLTPSDDGRYSP